MVWIRMTTERASLVAQRLKRLPAMRETRVRSLGREDPLEKEMATHSSTLAWRIPWTEEPGRLQSTGLQRVGHDWVTSLSKWTEMGEFNSDDHYIYYCGQESLGRNGVALIVNKRVWNAVLGCNLKNNRMISICFQGKPFNITVIQVYAPTKNTKEAEVDWFYEDLQGLLELTPKKDVYFNIGD